jgi:hypothetical protein
MLNFPASSTGQITAKERFKHQHQWKLLSSLQTLLHDIRANRERLP